ncbi:hypothetical protein V6N13_110259 [Hibiscus sabdariffa]
MGSQGASSGAERSTAVSEVSGSREASSTASSPKSAASEGAEEPCRFSASDATTGVGGACAAGATTTGATGSEAGALALVESR